MQVGDIGIARIPPTIQAVLAARLDQLGAEERRVLERASLVGQVFYRGAVAALSPAPSERELDAHLTALVRKDLIRSERSEEFGRDETYRFRHILIRDAAYEAIPKESRAEFHERFADWLERTRGDRVGEYEEILGYHLEQTHRYRKELGPLDDHARAVGRRAADHLASAGRRAFARNDLPASVNMLERAVALLPPGEPDRLELLVDLGMALHPSGEFAKAEAVLVEAIDAAEASGDARLRAHAALARLYLRMFTDPEFKLDEIHEEIDRAIPIFEERGDHRGLARAWRLLSWAHNLALRMASRQEALERALDHARRADDRREAILSLYGLTAPPVHGPMQVPEAMSFLEGLREQAGGDRTVEAGIALSLALLAAMRGRFEEGRELVGRCVAIQEDLGMTFEAASSAAEGFGFVEVLADDLAAAERHVRSGYESLARLGEKAYLSTQAAQLALILCALGRFAEADELTSISEEAAGAEDGLSQILWRLARAKILARRGELDRSEALAGEAVAIAEKSDTLDIFGNALMDQAEILELTGRKAEAISAVERAIALYERKGNVVSAKHAHRRLIQLSIAG